MSKFDFADRYAQAGLQPGVEMITARQTTATRVQETADKAQLLDLVSAYYGLKPDLSWFRDEMRKEDPTFSLATNARESVILAATILATKVAEKDAASILGVVVGSVQGRRVPTEARWLLDEALSTMAVHAATARIPFQVATQIKSIALPKVAEEITAAAGDVAALGTALGKVRSEGQEVARSLVRQMSDALAALNSNAAYQREESQILWWLFGEHSRSLTKPFSGLRPPQAALVAGMELGELTTVSELGPVAAPAVLERALRGKKEGKPLPVTLAAAIDGLGADLAKLKPVLPERVGLCPVLTAMAKAKEIGTGAWGNAFWNATGLDAGIEFEPMELALQIYYEHLLGLAE